MAYFKNLFWTILLKYFQAVTFNVYLKMFCFSVYVKKDLMISNIYVLRCIYISIIYRLDGAGVKILCWYYCLDNFCIENMFSTSSPCPPRGKLPALPMMNVTKQGEDQNCQRDLPVGAFPFPGHCAISWSHIAIALSPKAERGQTAALHTDCCVCGHWRGPGRVYAEDIRCLLTTATMSLWCQELYSAARCGEEDARNLHHYLTTCPQTFIHSSRIAW